MKIFINTWSRLYAFNIPSNLNAGLFFISLGPRYLTKYRYNTKRATACHVDPKRNQSSLLRSATKRGFYQISLFCF